MANNIFPEDIMISILTRLPVKTIIRFKSVCKPWYDLFSTPEFKKLHQAQFSSDPENQSFIIHKFISKKCRREPKNQFSIFNTEYSTKQPTILDHPFALNIRIDTVGCCNGLVCIRRGQEVVLWNPAMKLSKTIPLKDCGPSEMVSLGFGYDAIGDDFKLVIFCSSIKLASVATIYSANLDSWITVDVGFQFRWFKSRNKLIVNGNPYWDASVEGNEVLLCFDVSELVFKIVPVPNIYMMGLDEEAKVDLDGLVEEAETETGNETQTRTKTDIEVDLDGLVTEKETHVEFVDWNGALGAIVVNYDHVVAYRTTVEYVWVFDDIEGIWRNNHTFRPIEVDAYDCEVLRCTNKILCISPLSKLFVLDLETGCVKNLFDGARICNYFEVYGYIESLAHINGMQKVVQKNE